MSRNRVFRSALAAVLGTVALTSQGFATPVVVASSLPPVIAASAASESASSQALTDAIRFRTDSGLNADPTYVASVMADPTASSDAYGFALTAVEQADLDARIALENKMWPLEDYITAHPDAFGGIWFDQKHGGTAVIEISNGSQSLPADAAALVPDAANVQIQAVSNTRSSLEATASQIRTSLKALRASGMDVDQVGVDVPNNLVDVGVQNLTSAIRDSLLSSFGPNLEIYEAEPVHQVSLPTGCSTRSNCQLEGGLYVSNLGAWQCTSDFVFKYSGSHYLASAGHCWSQSWYKWYEDSGGARQIGVNFGYSYYSGMSADVLLMTTPVPTSTPKNLLYASDSNRTQAMTVAESNSNQQVGNYACGSGSTSGYHCGPILAVDQTETYGSITEYHMWEVDFRSASGDSGGAVFDSYVEQGLIDDAAGVDTFYSTVGWIDSVMGTTPCLTSAC